MPRRCLLLFAALALSAVAACGGKVIIDGVDGVDGGGGTRGAGGAPGTGTGSGGCDAASHTLDVADFDVSCMQASDCTSVFVGSFCSDCRCPLTPINVSALMKYQKEAQAADVGAPPWVCNCPEDVAKCVEGKCARQ